MTRPRVVVVGGGIAGIYFTYELKRLVDVEIVLIDSKHFHEFVIGIPMVFAGLVEFYDLLYPFSHMRKILHIMGDVSSIEDGRCIKLRESPKICGDYIVLAPGGQKIGNAEYWTVRGAEELSKKVAAAKAVRFIVNVITPVIGFQEIAFSLKTRHPEKEVSIHLVYIDDDYISLLQPWRRWAETAGLQLSDEPPPPKREGELYISVPSLVAHPLVERLEVDPATFETRYSRMYLIGDSSLIKLNLPPIGWGALWQAATLAKAIAGEISGGVFEITAETWDVTAGKDKFYQWLTHRMTSGTPLAHLRGLYDLWKNHVIKSLKSPI